MRLVLIEKTTLVHIDFEKELTKESIQELIVQKQVEHARSTGFLRNRLWNEIKILTKFKRNLS